MSPELLQMWRGFIDGGHSDDAKQTAAVQAAVENGFRRILNALGGKFELVEESDLIPKFADDGMTARLRKLVENGMDDTAIAGSLAATFGRPPQSG